MFETFRRNVGAVELFGAIFTHILGTLWNKLEQFILWDCRFIMEGNTCKFILSYIPLLIALLSLVIKTDVYSISHNIEWSLSWEILRCQISLQQNYRKPIFLHTHTHTHTHMISLFNGISTYMVYLIPKSSL